MTTAHSEFMFPELAPSEKPLTVSQCACGCGAEFTQRGYGRPRLFLNATHKARHYARRGRENTITFKADISTLDCEHLLQAIELASQEGEYWRERQAIEFLCKSGAGPVDALDALKTVLGWLK